MKNDNNQTWFQPPDLADPEFSLRLWEYVNERKGFTHLDVDALLNEVVKNASVAELVFNLLIDVDQKFFPPAHDTPKPPTQNDVPIKYFDED